MTVHLWSTHHAASESFCHTVNLPAFVRINMADGPGSRVLGAKRQPPNTHDMAQSPRNPLQMKQLRQPRLLALARKSAA